MPARELSALVFRSPSPKALTPHCDVQEGPEAEEEYDSAEEEQEEEEEGGK